jgi:hypothetical protein
LLVKIPFKNKIKCECGSGLVTFYERKETPMKDKRWSGTFKGSQEGKAQKYLAERCFQ